MKIQNLRNENPKLNNEDSCNFMDWSPCDISKNKLYLVLDTNVLISDLQKISHLKGKKLKGINRYIKRMMKLLIITKIILTKKFCII